MALGPITAALVAGSVATFLEYRSRRFSRWQSFKAQLEVAAELRDSDSELADRIVADVRSRADRATRQSDRTDRRLAIISAMAAIGALVTGAATIYQLVTGDVPTDPWQYAIYATLGVLGAVIGALMVEVVPDDEESNTST